MQSPLIMPIFQLDSVPTHIAALQTAKLLHDSEYFFPPLNMACTLSNLALTATCYLHSGTSPAAAEKLPFVGAALACSVATTAYALGIMVPRNKRMTFLSVEMNKHMQGGKDEKEFRQIQSQWRKLNYGELALGPEWRSGGMFHLESVADDFTLQAARRSCWGMRWRACTLCCSEEEDLLIEWNPTANGLCVVRITMYEWADRKNTQWMGWDRTYGVTQAQSNHRLFFPLFPGLLPPAAFPKPLPPDVPTRL